MSAVGSVLSRAVAGLGGPQVAVVVVAAGIVAGGLGGGFIAASGSGQSGSGSLPVYPCPDTGPALTTVLGGQKLLVTGRTADGGWLRIHFPLPGRTEAWVEAGPLTVSGSVDTLPIATCAPEFAAASPDVAPGATLTAIANNTPSPGPTPTPTASPTPSPVPTPSPTPNARPSLASLTVSTSKISYDRGSYCPTAVKKVTFRVKASDTTGIAGVTLFWREPGAGSYAQSAMTLASGTASSGTWQVTLDTTVNGITTAGRLAFYAVGRDTAGATRRIPASGASSIAVAVCANTGPAITSAASSSGSSLSWNPLGAPGNCRTATNITAVVKDIDGVKSVTLFYRRPGDTAYRSKAMNNKTIPGKWYANLDTLGDGIRIVSPPTDTLSWYIKAVDGKNVASQTKARLITVRRCDTEATFDGGFPTTRTPYQCTTSKTATMTIGVYANDRDQPNGGLKVVIYWILTDSRGTNRISGHMTARTPAGSVSSYYQGTTAAFIGSIYKAGVVTAWAVTTDVYGGTTTMSPRSVTQTNCG